MKELETNGCNVWSYNLKVKLRRRFSIEEIKAVLKSKCLSIANIREAIYSVSQEKMIQCLIKDDIKIDVVFVLAGQGIQTQTLKKLKEIFPNARFIWYIWDNIIFLKDYEKNKKYYDNIISFDQEEAVKEKIDYLPTFFCREIIAAKEYDFSFVGWAYDNRIKSLIDIMNKVNSENIYIYLKTSWQNLIRNIFNWRWWRLRKYIHFTSLPYNDTLEIMAKSKAIIDIPVTAQRGITLRPLEAMGVNSKIVTTSISIKKMDIYDADRICIFKEDNFKYNKEWLDAEYKKPQTEILYKYHVKNFVITLLRDYFM